MGQAVKSREHVAAHALTAVFLILSAALSVAVLAKRNISDDEANTLAIVTSPISSIVHLAETMDVHPPGMYLLAHLAWHIIPSYRWMNLVPCAVLYVGLAVFLFALTPLFHHTRTRLLLLLLATLHPELLLWSNTFRWYSWWTGLALIALTLALQPRIVKPVLLPGRAIVLGILLAALLYLNYITLLFFIALAAAMLLRYRYQPRRELILAAAIVCVAFLLLSAYQLHTMVSVHLASAAGQRAHVLTSAARLTIALSASEAYLPWHPLALLACLGFMVLCVIGILQLTRRTPELPPLDNTSGLLRALTVFGLLFCGLVVFSGLGGKPRSAILLVPVLAPLAAACGEHLRAWAQNAFLALFSLWSCIGVTHMLMRSGLAKATMNDRPEQVTQFVLKNAKGGCAIVVTYDIGLSFALAQAHLPNVVALSAIYGDVPAGREMSQIGNCASVYLYLVRSYLGVDKEWEHSMSADLNAAAQSFTGPTQINNFSLDSDAMYKRRLAQLPLLGKDLQDAADMPDYRFVVVSGSIDPKQSAKLTQQLPDFMAVR